MTKLVIVRSSSTTITLALKVLLLQTELHIQPSGRQFIEVLSMTLWLQFKKHLEEVKKDNVIFSAHFGTKSSCNTDFPAELKTIHWPKPTSILTVFLQPLWKEVTTTMEDNQSTHVDLKDIILILNWLRPMFRTSICLPTSSFLCKNQRRCSTGLSLKISRHNPIQEWLACLILMMGEILTSTLCGKRPFRLTDVFSMQKKSGWSKIKMRQEDQLN